MKTRYRNNLISNLISSKNRISFFREIPVNKQGFILLTLSKRIQEEILNKLKDQEIIKLLHYLDPDEVTDILQRINSRRRKRILRKLSEDIREKVEFLLKFDPNTAAGLMSLDYLEVSKNMTLSEVLKLVQKHEKRTGKFPAVLVVENGFLIGELPGYLFALHKGREKIGKYVKKIPSIKYNKDEKEAVSYTHLTLPTN